MDKKERLENLLDFIDRNDREHDFKNLYAKLEDEFKIERANNSDLRTNRYLNNLRQTMEKQAEEYTKANAKKKRAAPEEFRSFWNHFKQDVSEGML